MNKQGGGSEPTDILLVEDNPGDIRLTKEAFTEAQIAHTLHVVTDGVGALDFLSKRGEYADAPCPNIILLDRNLPRKNGEEVLAEITDVPKLVRIPVVVLTSSSAEEDIARAYERGAAAYLTKPVDPEEFINTIQSFQTFWFKTARLPPV